MLRGVESNSSPVSESLLRPPPQLAPLIIRLHAWRAAGRRIFLLASAWPHEGKTNVTLDLGRLAAYNHLKVLVVDGDIHCPALSRRLDCPETGGLADCLEGRPIQVIPLDPYFFALGVGSSDHGDEFRPALESRARLQAATADFDLVLIDSPALSASSLALSLASLCDGVIVVASKKTFASYPDDAAVQQLRMQGVPLEGVIVTQEEAASTTYYKRSKSLWASLLSWVGLRA